MALEGMVPGEINKDKVRESFRRNFGRDIEVPAKIEVINEGSLECSHSRGNYLRNGFDGDAYWCDECTYHIRRDYSPGHPFPFPPNSLISTPNPQYGGLEFYSFKVNERGDVMKLSREKWVPRNIKE